MARAETAAHKEDRRVKRTKKQLEKSLIQLLETKPIQDITVRELTELADINRGTFYLYYRDIFDMVSKVEEGYYERFVDLLDSHQEEPVYRQIEIFLEDLFCFIGENGQTCKVLLGEHGDIVFTQKLLNVVRERCLKSWEMTRGISETDFDYRYSFVTSGCIGIIRSWVERNCPEDARKMSKLAFSMIRQGSSESRAG